MPRLLRWNRKWLVRVGAGLAVLGVVLGVARAWVVPALITRALEKQLGGPVTFRGWWVNGHSAGVVGLVVYAGPSRVGSRAWLRSERVTTDLTLGKILRGRLQPGRVTIRAPEVTIRLDRRGELLDTIDPGGGAKAAALPVLVADGGQVTIQQEGRPEMVVRQVVARLAPDGDMLSLAARSADLEWGPVQVLGRFRPDFAVGGLVLKSERPIRLTPARAAAVPFVTPEVWENVVPDGEVDVRIALERGQFGEGRTSRVRTELGLHDATVGSPALDLTATGTSGTVVVDDLKVLLQDVSGRAIDGRVVARGTLDFSRSPPVFDVGLDLAGINVADTPARWQLAELGVTGHLTGQARLHAVFRPDAVDLSGTTGEARVEGGVIQGIPFKSLRLVLSAKGKGLHYDTAKPGSSASPRPNRVPLVARPPVLRQPGSKTLVGKPPVPPGGWALALISLVAFQAPAPQPPAIELPKSLTTHLELEDVDIKQLIARVENLIRFPVPVPIAGKLSLEADATIPLGKLRTIRGYAFHGDLTLTGASLYGVDVGRVSARIDLADGVLVLSDLRGRLVDRPGGGLDNPPEALADEVPRTGPLPPGGFRGTLRAAIDPPGPLTARFEGQELPLGELAAPALPRPTPLSGLATLRVDATTDLKAARDPKAWTATGDATSRQIQFRDARLDQCAFRFTLKHARLEVPELTARLQDRPLEARFGIDLALPYAFRGHLDVTAWDVARVLAWRTGQADETLGGTFSARAEASGTLWPRRVTSEGQGRFDRLTAGPVVVGDVPFTWTTRGDAVAVSVDARPFGGRVEVEARLPLTSGPPITASATLTAIDTAQLGAAVPGARLALAGKASGKIDVTAAPGGSKLDVTGRLSAPELTVQGIPAEQVQVALSTREQALAYEVKAESLGATVRLTGSLPLGPAPRGRVSDGEIRAIGFLLERVWKARGIGGATARMLGRGAVNANLRAVLQGPDAGLYTHGFVELRDLKWGERLTLGRLRGVMAGTPTGWRIDPVSGDLLGGPVSGFLWAASPAAGAGGAGRQVGFELRVDRASLSGVRAFLPGMPRDLEGFGTLRLSGAAGDPFRATAELTVAQARVAGLPLSDLKVPAELVSTGGHSAGVLRLRRWAARFAGGQFRGDASFRVGEDRSFQSELTLTNLDLEPIARVFHEGPRPASGRVSGRVTIGGPNPEQPQQYRGRVDLNLSDASLVALPVFRELDRFLGAARGGLFERGHLTGTLAGRQIVVEPLTLEGRLAQVHGTGTVSLDGKLNLEMLINTNQIIPQTGQALVGLIPGLRNALGRNQEASLQVTNFLSNRLLKLRVTGTVWNPSVALDPGISVANTAVSFFSGVLKLPLGLIK